MNTNQTFITRIPNSNKGIVNLRVLALQNIEDAGQNKPLLLGLCPGANITILEEKKVWKNDNVKTYYKFAVNSITGDHKIFNPKTLPKKLWVFGEGILKHMVSTTSILMSKKNSTL